MHHSGAKLSSGDNIYGDDFDAQFVAPTHLAVRCTKTSLSRDQETGSPSCPIDGRFIL